MEAPRELVGKWINYSSLTENKSHPMGHKNQTRLLKAHPIDPMAEWMDSRKLEAVQVDHRHSPQIQGVLFFVFLRENLPLWKKWSESQLGWFSIPNMMGKS